MIIQLYIQGEQVELFKDESVTITDSIQNVKDIEKGRKIKVKNKI